MQLWHIEDDKLHLNLHIGQKRAWKSERRFIVVLAGTQGGKTSYGPWHLWREIQHSGRGDYLAVTASFDLFKLKMLPALRETFEHILRIGRYWSGDRIIEIAENFEPGRFKAKRADDVMWARIILRSAVAEGGLEATTANYAWLDEAGQDSFTLETWEAVLRRLSIAQGGALLTTTIYNLGWLKTEVYDPWLAGDPDIDVIQFPSYVNPAFPRKEFERAQRKMADWRFQMFYAGQFAKPEGLVYDAFDEAVHLVEPFEIPATWSRFLGVDFGGTNTAVVWLAHDHAAKTYYLYREYLGGGKTSKEHADDVRKFPDENLIRGAWGGAGSEDQSRRDWRAGGLNILQPPIGEIEAGIDRVITLFKANQLKVFANCRGVRDELATYRRKSNRSGVVTDEIENKREFHRLDALRYVASALVRAPKSSVDFV